MDGLSVFPPEILCRILQSCSNFSDLLSLSSTCKHVHMVWAQNSTAVITKPLIATLDVPSFDDALLAVRATTIIRKAIFSGLDIPRSFPFSELLAGPREPCFDELKLVLDFRHLVRCAEYTFLHGIKGNEHSSYTTALSMRELFTDDDWVQFRTRFHRAMYRVFLSGAVLYGAYHEPYDLARKDENHDQEFLQISTGAYDLEEPGRIHFHHQLRAVDIQYLEKFAIYNLANQEGGEVDQWECENKEVIFAPLAKWLIEDGRVRGERNYQEDLHDDLALPVGSQEAEHEEEVEEEEEEADLETSFNRGELGSMEEIMLLIGAYEYLTNTLQNLDGHQWLGRSHISDQAVVMPRRVGVIIYGIFAMEEICMPHNFNDSGQALLVARPLRYLDTPSRQTEHVKHNQTVQQRIEDIPYVIYQLQCGHTKSRDSWRNPAPPPMYDLFIYAARRFLGCKFQPEFFEVRADSGYIQQFEWGGVFVEPDHPFEKLIPLSSVHA